MIRVTIDGRAVDALPGQTILDAALGAGIYIPHLCSHPDLPSHGGCKLCTVELDGRPRPVRSCEVIAEDGMRVRSSTDELEHLRRVAMELMLAGHPKDCTSCAAYLNCELQALMQYLGVAHSRLREIDKETARIGHSDSIVRRDMVRCIQCTRCIRACADLRGVGVLTLNHRDGESYVGTVGDRPLAETDCRFCSACVEVCPTGAIMDAPGLFATNVPKVAAQVPCRQGCPAHTDVPLYLQLARESRYSESVAVFREKLTFPHSLGYICGHACETGCKRGKVDWPISIREVKRFAVEQDPDQRWRERSAVAAASGRTVAVVGGGPAGLTAAYYLARKGHAVTVLERMPRAGGMLSYGIPRYRLPQQVVDGEIGILTGDAPFRIETDANVRDITELRRGHDAVLVAVGAQAGRRPGAYQQAWPNAHDGVDLCRRWNCGESPDLGRTVTVFGGGNVAFDCARNARRHGAEQVRIMCLEPADRMLADPQELAEALAEGIEVVNSVSLLSLGTHADRVVSLRLARVRDFAFTDQGLRIDLEEGSEDEVGTDTIIFATGQQTDLSPEFGPALGRGGLVLTGDDASTSLPGVFAAGDAVTGTRTVIEAIAAARQAASAIDRFLGGDGDIEDMFFDRRPHEPKLEPVPDFLGMPRTDCRSADAVRSETSRCLHCELRGDIDSVKYWTDPVYQQARTVTP